LGKDCEDAGGVDEPTKHDVLLRKTKIQNKRNGVCRALTQYNAFGETHGEMSEIVSND
jgi:hypothetical protein